MSDADTKSTVFPVVEEEGTTVGDIEGIDIDVPVNILGPNPNGFEVDNLYLDANGIVSFE